MKKYCVLNSECPFKHMQVMIHFICFDFVCWEAVINKQILICLPNQGSLLIRFIQSAIRYRQTFDHSRTYMEILEILEICLKVNKTKFDAFNLVLSGL